MRRRTFVSAFILTTILNTGIAIALAPQAEPAPRAAVVVQFPDQRDGRPVPESPKIPLAKSQRCPKWEPWFAAKGLPVDTFSYIAWRESRCNPLAHNKTLNRDGSQDYGLVQINSSWKTVTANICGAPKGQLDVLFDPECNLSVAKYLYENGGLRHWSL